MAAIVRSGARRLAGSALLQRAPAAGAPIKRTPASGACPARFMSTTYQHVRRREPPESLSQALEEIEARKEVLYDLLAKPETTGRQNMQLLKFLSTLIKPRPNDSRWRRMRALELSKEVIKLSIPFSGSALACFAVLELELIRRALNKKRKQRADAAASAAAEEEKLAHAAARALDQMDLRGEIVQNRPTPFSCLDVSRQAYPLSIQHVRRRGPPESLSQAPEEIEARKEVLYDLLAKPETTGRQNMQLLKFLSTLIKPRPNDSRWMRALEVSKEVIQIGIPFSGSALACFAVLELELIRRALNKKRQQQADAAAAAAAEEEKVAHAAARALDQMDLRGEISHLRAERQQLAHELAANVQALGGKPQS